jgi:hypothetical protein
MVVGDEWHDQTFPYTTRVWTAQGWYPPVDA